MSAWVFDGVVISAERLTRVSRRDQRRGRIYTLDMALSRHFSYPFSFHPNPIFQAKIKAWDHGKGHGSGRDRDLFVTNKPLKNKQGHAVTVVTPELPYHARARGGLGENLSYARAQDRDRVTFYPKKGFWRDISIGYKGHAQGHARVTVRDLGVTPLPALRSTHCLLGEYYG